MWDFHHSEVMLRNLPNNYTRDMFLSLLDEQGLSGLYDFVYLPMDFCRDATWAMPLWTLWILDDPLEVCIFSMFKSFYESQFIFKACVM